MRTKWTPTESSTCALWRALTARMTASVHVGNIFESHKGEEDYASRAGRSIGLSIKGKL